MKTLVNLSIKMPGNFNPAGTSAVIAGLTPQSPINNKAIATYNLYLFFPCEFQSYQN